MLYLNDERITINQITNYKGKDEVILKLKRGYEELYEKFFSKGYLVKFKLGDAYTFKQSKGFKEFKGGILIPFGENVKTKTGVSMLRYCENYYIKDGNPQYEPRSEWFNKQKTFNEHDIELALFYYKVSTVVVAGNKIVLEDIEKDASIKAGKRGSESAVDFYLYNEASPIYNDRDKLIELAYIFEIPNASGKSDNILRNAIYDKVKSRSQIKKFTDAVTSKTPFYSALAAIQVGLDEKVLVYEKFKWYFDTEDGKVEICSVGVAEVEKKKDVLATKLLTSPDVYKELRVSIGLQEPDEEIDTDDDPEPDDDKPTGKGKKELKIKDMSIDDLRHISVESLKRGELMSICSKLKVGNITSKPTVDLLEIVSKWHSEYFASE